MRDSFESKKLALLRILQILEKYSDFDHPLTQDAILAYLERDYGIVLEHKAVSKNLSLLQEAGIEIEMRNRKGVYLAARRLENSELQLLIDSVMCSKYIPQSNAMQIVDALKNMGNIYFKPALLTVQNVGAVHRSPSKEIFYTIENLSEAIAQDRKVRFIYNQYGLDKKLHPKWDKPKCVNPYKLVANGGFYYLIANVDAYDNLAHFRVDKITDITVTDQPRKNICDTKDGNIELGAYLTAHPYMYTGQTSHIRIRLDAEQIGCLIDTFGDTFSVTDQGDAYVEVSLTANEQDAYLWALQHGDCAEILAPQHLRDRIRNTVSSMSNRYLCS